MQRFLKLIRRNSWSSSNATEVERSNSQNPNDGSKPSGSGRRKNSSASLLNPGVRRRVYVNRQIPSDELDEYGYPLARYASNRIQTAKYTVITFLPKNLFEQFRGVANLYFLFLVILQMFPIFGATEPGLAVMPIGAILLITAIKDAVEDYKRHKSDEAVNKAKTKTLKGWRNVNEMDAVDRRASRWHIFSRLFKYCLSCFGYRVSSRRDSIDAAKTKSKAGKIKGSSRFSNPEDYIEITPDGIGSLRTKARSIFAKEPHRKKKPYRPGMIPHSVIRRTPTRPEDLDAANATAIQNGVPLEAVLTSGSAVSAQDCCTSRWCETLWEDVRVGDLVYLENDEAVPADIIILSTSEPDGLCYVETQNLDGETNLKIRRSLNATNELRTPADCEKAQFYIESEPPHANLYSYNGVLRWSITNEEDDDESDNEYPNSGVAHTKTEAITHNEILLRGHVLRNTGFVIGLVMFTGNDTKIMLNSGKTPSKRSKMEKGTNPHVIANFILLGLICIGCAIASSIYYNENTSAQYFEFGSDASNAALAGFLTFWITLILFQNIVPISLYISVEIVKTLAAYFIFSDIDMYYEPLDQPCIPKTWNISDDLGQIEYIFSDKTGTLTQNVMEFRRCTINGVVYGIGETEATLGSQMREAASDKKTDPLKDTKFQKAKTEMFEKQAQLFTNHYIGPNATFVDPKLFDDLAGLDAPGSYDDVNNQATAIVHFLSALAICHTVLPERPDEDNEYNIVYKAQSPDEAALVSTARDLGFAFLGREHDTIILEAMGERKEFQLLSVLEFNSSRKRMSVIMRSPEGGRLVMLCKGADSVIYERLAKECGGSLELRAAQKRIKEATLAHLESFANEGLRTLCVAYRFIEEKEYADWSVRYQEASASISNREEKIEEVCEEIEHDLMLIGGTAIEDRLQEGVPETIALLSQAGIRIWVLTGDKTETAINIGFAANLLQKDMLLIIINASTKESTLEQLKEALDKFWGGDQQGESKKHALIIDGETLKYALEKPCKELTLELGRRCESVLCCRVSPMQKAKVVNLVKRGLNVMTLAIGDGANDVSMIQEANVGVGISGEEGRQAVMASDYAIAQFRFLGKLLLVHGRWSYLRTAEMILTFFYKNIVWTIVLCWYQFFCGFTGTMMFDYSFIMLFNLVFTSLPCIFLGVFDQDLSAADSLAHPPLYMMGLRNEKFTGVRFWLHILDALYQSVVCFFIPYFMFVGPHMSSDGYDTNGIIELGTIIAAIAVVVANGYVGITIFSWTWLMGGIIIGSIATYFVWTAVYSQFNTFNFLGEDILFSEVSFWLCLILTFAIAMLPRYVFKVYLHQYRPLDNDIIRERVICKSFKPESKLEEEVPIVHITSQIVGSSIMPNRPDSAATNPSESFSLEDQDISFSSDRPISLPSPTLMRPSVPRAISSVSNRSDQLMYMKSGKRMSFTGFAFSSDDESVFDSFRKSVYRPYNAMSQPDLHLSQRNSISEERPFDHLNQDWMMLRPIHLTRSESAPAEALANREHKRSLTRSGLKDSLAAAVAGIGSAVAGVGLGPTMIPPAHFGSVSSSGQNLTSAALEAQPTISVDSSSLHPIDIANRKVRFANLRGLVNPRRMSNVSAVSEEGSTLGSDSASRPTSFLPSGNTSLHPTDPGEPNQINAERSLINVEPSQINVEPMEILVQPEIRVEGGEQNPARPVRRTSMGGPLGGTDITEMRNLGKDGGEGPKSMD